jgi:DNA-binding response OmpR family regulator
LENILVVEDNSALRIIEIRQLGRIISNAQVFGASTAYDAVCIAREYPLSLVVMDCGLPDARGIDLIDMLLPHCSEATFIVASANPPELSEMRRLTPRVLLINKPFEPEALGDMAALAMHQSSHPPEPAKVDTINHQTVFSGSERHDILNILGEAMADICVMETDLLAELENPDEMRKILSEGIPSLKQSIKLAASRIKQLFDLQ